VNVATRFAIPFTSIYVAHLNDVTARNQQQEIYKQKRVSAVKKRVCTVAINNVYNCNYKVLYTVANIKITYQFVRSYIDIALTARLTFVL